jgi:hypothetical protein
MAAFKSLVAVVLLLAMSSMHDVILNALQLQSSIATICAAFKENPR